MEFLELLSDEMKEYIKTRSGIVCSLFDHENKETHILTFREMLALLPDNL